MPKQGNYDVTMTLVLVHTQHAILVQPMLHCRVVDSAAQRARHAERLREGPLPA